MRYIGGKSKIAKELARQIRVRTNATEIYEPFMGGAAMTARLADEFETVTPGEVNADLVALWRVAARGWVPPSDITPQEYARMKEDPVPSAYRGFVGFGCSFGGKWFGGYARGGFNADGSPRNYAGESSRAVARIGSAIATATRGGELIYHRSYEETPIIPGTAIYCDPPYQDTQGYDAVSGFDSGAFWGWAREATKAGVDVFVSEYSAPDDFARVWEKGKVKMLPKAEQCREVAREGLWVYVG